MLNIAYDNIYSRFLSLVKAYDLVELYQEDETSAQELLDEWLLSVKSDVKVRRLLSNIKLDSENRVINCTIRNSQGDDDSDKDFLTDLFGIGIVWKWSSSQYMSVLNTGFLIGGKQGQFYSQANHMNQLKNMCDECRSDFYKQIKNYGCINNTYLGTKT